MQINNLWPFTFYMHVFKSKELVPSAEIVAWVNHFIDSHYLSEGGRNME